MPCSGNHKKGWLVALFLLNTVCSFAQFIKYDEASVTKQFPGISLVFDRIFNNSSLDSFYEKLYRLKKSGKGTVSIVHLGDSHIQSDHLPGVVRKGLQDFFGGKEKGARASKKNTEIVRKSFTGKKDSSGLLYHNLGINGARFETFIGAPSFWEELPSLQADLFIISLGTNDAQGREFNEAEFTRDLNELIRKLKAASPQAALLFTTTADSFKGRRPNRELWNLNLSLFSFCNSNNIPIWDLYRITNGFGSAQDWIRRGMMSRDGVHYTAKGYQLQGRLLFNAIAKGYNAYVGSF